MDKSIHCILLGHGEPCMLIEPSPILVWHAFSVLNVQCDYADFVRVAIGIVRRRQPLHFKDETRTYTTSRLSRIGTISSTRCFGVLPSDVRPVAQFYKDRDQGDE